MSIFAFIILILILIGLGVGIFFYMRARERGRILGSFDMVLFLVLMPKYDISKGDVMQKEEKELISHMEQVFANFLYLKEPGFFKRMIVGSPRVAFEIASQTGGSDIEFYVGVPKNLETAFEKYIQGVYPRAIIEKIPQDYTIFEPQGFSAGAYLKLTEPAIFPLHTYQALDKDPLAILTNALSKIAADEGAAIQLVISPLPQASWKKTGDKVLMKIQEGKSIRVAVKEGSRSNLLEILTELTAGLTSTAAQRERERERLGTSRELEVDQRTLNAIQTKIQKQVFETNIRLVASAKTQARADEILGHLIGSFGQFSLAALNSLEAVQVKKKNLKKLIYNFSFRNFNPTQKNILNIEELTSLYHFPTRFIETPYVKMAKVGVSAPPTELLEQGINVVGKVDFRGEEKIVSFASREDRRRHFYIIGQTGTGKSSLLREMIRQDIEQGEGVAVIDPHGDLIEATLAHIPKERVEDVVLFEPFDLERPMGLNMLEYDTPEQKDFAVQEMIAIFHKLFPPEIIGPMFEHYMRNAMLAIIADKNNPGTLVEIPRMFTDSIFMEERLRKVTDPVVREFWLHEWKQTTGSTKSDMLGYVVSKIGRFIGNEMMRNIIGQSRSAFDLSAIMDEKKIFLANLSKGQTGEVNSSLLGLILVSKIQMAAMRRAGVSEEERKDFYLYIDEFQNFTTDSIATILSEARKYRLNLIIAHQYIPQLTEDIKNAVLGNVGSIGAFRVGAEDAEFLQKQFEPEFSQFDLVNLDNFNLIIKLMIKGKVHPAFRIETITPQEGNPSIVPPIKEMVKLKYGRPKREVENEIMQRSRLAGITDIKESRVPTDRL